MLAVSVSQPEMEPTKLIFPSILADRRQRTERVEKMEVNQLYYLKNGHPAIDAVCIANDSRSEAYLLLIQISISGYASHKSKFDGIYSKMEEKKKL